MKCSSHKIAGENRLVTLAAVCGTGFWTTGTLISTALVETLPTMSDGVIFLFVSLTWGGSDKPAYIFLPCDCHTQLFFDLGDPTSLSLGNGPEPGTIYLGVAIGQGEAVLLDQRAEGWMERAGCREVGGHPSQ